MIKDRDTKEEGHGVRHVLYACISRVRSFTSQASCLHVSISRKAYDEQRE